jgi:redox-sensitive bicupin YhaK (pirin superfamily)
MSRYPDKDPAEPARETPRIAFVLEGKMRDLGGFSVRRVLPAMHHRRVGPFVFFDHMGPFNVEPGRDVEVRPHPHIGLATVTYLFDGEIIHRDSLGSKQAIVPGDVNLMTAGRGIVHSERTDEEAIKRGGLAHGLQCWVGLPTKDEECEPAFSHTPSRDIPTAEHGGFEVRVVLGSAYGVTSPVPVKSSTLFVDARMGAGQTLEPPADAQELAAYVVEGKVTCDGAEFEGGTMLVFRGSERPVVKAEETSHVVLIGGASLDGERYLFWNFVSSSKERLERAKADWKAGRFPKVPGDETEFIPLPE